MSRNNDERINELLSANNELVERYRSAVKRAEEAEASAANRAKLLEEVVQFYNRELTAKTLELASATNMINGFYVKQATRVEAFEAARRYYGKHRLVSIERINDWMDWFLMGADHQIEFDAPILTSVFDFPFPEMGYGYAAGIAFVVANDI